MGVSEGVNIIEHDFRVAHIDHAGDGLQTVMTDDSTLYVACVVAVADGLEGATAREGDLDNHLRGLYSVEADTGGSAGID